jgi:hypothetical protein
MCADETHRFTWGSMAGGWIGKDQENSRKTYRIASQLEEVDRSEQQVEVDDETARTERQAVMRAENAEKQRKEKAKRKITGPMSDRQVAKAQKASTQHFRPTDGS